MPKLRYLKVSFNQSIHTDDIPKFRAAIIEKTERQSSLFHNHVSDSTVLYRYPLIQYKMIDDKASIVCLQSGTDDIHYLLQQSEMNLRIGRNMTDFEIEEVDLHFDQVAIQDNSLSYTITNWMALNQKHYAQWRAYEDDCEAQFAMLQKILCGNILSFAKGINWWIDEAVQVKITKIKSIQIVKFKQKEVLSFTVDFLTNISLPEFIGLGKGVSVGFGMIKKNRNPTADLIEIS